MSMYDPPAPQLNGRQLVAWMERHGGLASVHVRPVFGGWANTLACKDGSRLTTTKAQDEAIARELDA